jgi:GNAT superfamily N-acetyltransferase
MSSAPSYDILDYEDRWLDQILSMWESIQGERVSAAEFRWQFKENPTGLSNIHLAVHDGEVIGVVSHSALRMWINGREEVVPFFLNVDTHPDYRGMGIFSTLAGTGEAYVREAGAELMMGVPNEQAKRIWVGRLGWTAVPGPRATARMLKPLALAKGLASRNSAQDGCGQMADGPEGPITVTKELFLEPIDEFGSWVDSLWEANRPQTKNVVVSSAEHLNWRFINTPLGPYRSFAVRCGVESVGYVVVGVTQKRGTTFSYLAHSLLEPRYHRYYSRCRARALATVRAKCSAALDLTNTGERLGLRGGFLPTPKQFDLIYKTTRPGGPYSGPSGDCWRLQLGDFDFF